MTDITCLLGSPRAGGNSDQLAMALCNAAETAGATVARHALRDLTFAGCRTLMGCKTGGVACAQNDGLTPVLEDVARSRITVLATPIFFCNMSGQTKLALDRFFSFLVPDYVTADTSSRLGRDRTLVLVQTQGEGSDRYGHLLDDYAAALDKLGFSGRFLIRACGVREPGDLAAHPEVLRKAEDLGRHLVQPGERADHAP